MSIANTAVWEARSLGSTTGGGFWVPGSSGVDYSQQNSPQYSLTNGTSNGTTVILTVSAATDMVGNGVYIAGGSGSLAAQWRQVVSVSAGVSITVDANVTTSSGLTLHVGGALSDPQIINTNAVISNRVYVKADGTYTFTSTTIFAMDNRDVAPYWWTGYTTTRGDGGRAVWTTSTNSISMIQNSHSVNSINTMVENIAFSTTASSRAPCVSVDGSVPWYQCGFTNCTFDGFTNAFLGDGSSNAEFWPLVLTTCEVKNSTANGVQISSPGVFNVCYFHNNGGHGVFHIQGGSSSQFVGITAYRCVFAANGSAGAAQTNQNSSSQFKTATFQNCVFYSNTSDGLLLTSSSGPAGPQLLNCIFYGNGGFGINNTSEPTAVLVQKNNAFGANTSGNRNNLATDPTDVALSGDPFTSGGSSDFSLNSTAGAGTACNGAGYPGVTLFGTGHESIGALTPSGGGGGTTTIVIGRNVTNFMGEQGAF